MRVLTESERFAAFGLYRTVPVESSPGSLVGNIVRAVLSLLVPVLFVFANPRSGIAQDEIYTPQAWEIGEIVFRGNESVDDGKLRDIIDLRSGEEFLEWQLQSAMDEITSYYVSRGFIEVSVGEQRRVRFDEKKVDIEIDIYEGMQVHVRTVRISDILLVSKKDARKYLDIEPGDPFSSRKLDEFELILKDVYASKGYPYLAVEPDFSFTHDRDSVDITIDIEEGKMTYLGDVTVVGNERIDTDIIMRMLRVKRGDVFNPEKIQVSQENVYQIGVFRSVFFDIQGLEEQRDTLDLLIEVREDDFRSIGFGVGYGSAQGVRLSGEWGRANTFDRAEQLTVRAEGSKAFETSSAYNTTGSFAVSWSEPVFFALNTRSLYSASYQHLDLKAFDKTGISGRLQLSRFSGRKRRLSFQFLLESSEITNVDEEQGNVPDDILRNIGKHIRNSVEFSYVRDRTDDFFNPTKGTVMKLTTVMTGGPLIGDRDYYKFIGEYALYRGVRFLGIRLTAASRLKLGVVKEFGTSEPVPPEEQFSIGGANSLRGYRELSIGLISQEDQRPGNYLIQLNVEGRFPIWRGLDGVLFFDVANIYDNDFYPRRPFLLSSTGAGLRYRTPIGPVRVEQAVRLDENFGTDRMLGRLHVSIGNPF